MKPGNPWSVKGIQPAARQAAKEAARRHGMTLGQWLNHVIMDSNEDPTQTPVEPQPERARPAPYQRAPEPHMAPQPAVAQPAAALPPKSQQLHDKIEGLAARLDSIVNKQSGQVDLDQWQAPSDNRSGWGDIAVRTLSADETANAAPPPPEPPAPSKSEIFGDRISALTEKLDVVVQARAETKSRSDQNLLEFETALRNVINHIEVSDRQNTDVMKSIQTRLSELSSRTAVSNNDTVQQLTGTISQMEERLSHLSQRVLKSESETGELSRFEEKIKSLANRLDNSLEREADPQVLALEERTKHLTSQLNELLRAAKDTNAADQYETRLNDTVQQLTDTIGQIEGRLSHLSQRVMKAETETSELSEFEEQIKSLSNRLDSLPERKADPQFLALEERTKQLASQLDAFQQSSKDAKTAAQHEARLKDTVQQLTDTITQMEGRLSHLSQRVMKAEIENNDLSVFEEKINSLASRLDQSLEREADPQVQLLEKRTNQLASQLEDFLQASKDSQIDKLTETKLNEISDRLKISEKDNSKLSALEDSINQLFEAVEENRNLAKDTVFDAGQKSLETMESIADQAAKKAAERAAQRSAEHVAAIMADDGLNKKEVTASIADLRDEVHNLQETAIQAARRSAEQTISAGLSGQATKAITEPMMALRQQLDQLQDTSKSTELRNQDTLEAVHDTLQKVVERLVALETSDPHMADRPPLPALSIPEIGLKSPERTEHRDATSIEIEDGPVLDDLTDDSEIADDDSPRSGSEFGIHPAPFDASSPARKNRGMDSATQSSDGPDSSAGKDNADRPASTLNHNFLEAARRAAQAASQMPKNPAVDDGNEGREQESKGNFLSKATESDKKRKTLLLVAAAVLLIIGALSAGSLMSGKSTKIANAKVNPPVAAVSKVKSTATKSNKQSVDEPATMAPIAASPKKTPGPEVSSPTSAKTAQGSKSEQGVQKSIASGSPQTGTLPASNIAPAKTNSTLSSKITTTAATKKELTGIDQRVTPAKSIKQTRLNTTTPTQSTVRNVVPRAQPSEPLPPEAIGPIALRQAAASGDAAAQFEIASRFTAGKLVPKNFSKAIFWYQKAAAQGLAPAQYRLGTFYEKGRGVAKDKTAARNWYERAAAKGNLKAIHNLAVIHADGSKGKPDFAKAGLWFRKAAELGLADSQYNLAILHDRGLGVSKDQSSAYFWFQIAGSQGDKDASARAAIIEKRMTPDQIARTKLLISNWTPTTLDKSANEVAQPFDGWQTTSTAPTTTNSTFTPKELVVLTQGYLTRLGFDPGPTDGIMGSKTREAIEEFQRQNQMPVSGNVNTSLVRKLKAVAG